MTFADKTTARVAAIAAGVPVVPGTNAPITSAEEARLYCIELHCNVLYSIALYCTVLCCIAMY